MGAECFGKRLGLSVAVGTLDHSGGPRKVSDPSWKEAVPKGLRWTLSAGCP